MVSGIDTLRTKWVVSGASPPERTADDRQPLPLSSETV
jgi:hypothetical protein